MRWLRNWWLARFTVLLTRQDYEHFRGMCECRGILYIVTDCRIIRYDPEREQFSTEVYTR